MRAHLTDELLDRTAREPGRVQSYIFDTELPGFACVIGAHTQTFVYHYRDRAGVKVRRTIGHRTATLNVHRAREMARDAMHGVKGDARAVLRQAEQRLYYAIVDWITAMILVRVNETIRGPDRAPMRGPRGNRESE